MRSAAVRKSEPRFDQPDDGRVFKQDPPFQTPGVRTPQSRIERALNTFMAYASNGGGLEGFKYLLAAPAAAGTIAVFFGLVALDQYYGGSFLRLPPLPEVMQLDSARAERELQASEVQVSSLMDAEFAGAAQITVREAAKETHAPRAKDVAPKMFRTENFARAEASAGLENVWRDDTYAGVENVVREEIPAVENVLREEAAAAREAREIVAPRPESSPESVIAKIAAPPERTSGVERIESAGAPAKTETPRVFSAGELPNQPFAPRPLAEEDEAKEEAKSPSTVQGSEPEAPVAETVASVSKTESPGKTQGPNQEDSVAAKKSVVKAAKAEPKTQTAVSAEREKNRQAEAGVKTEAVAPASAKPADRSEARVEPAKASKPVERSEIRAGHEDTKAAPPDFAKQAVDREAPEPIGQIVGTIDRVERTARTEERVNAAGLPEAKREERAAKPDETPARSESSVTERAVVVEPIERVQETAARVEREVVETVEPVQRAERAEKTVEVERPAERIGRTEVERMKIIERVEGPQAGRPEKAERTGRAEIERTKAVERIEVARPEKVERIERAAVERPEKVERVERAERVERPEKVERAEKAERPEKAERVERAERVDRPELGRN